MIRSLIRGFLFKCLFVVVGLQQLAAADALPTIVDLQREYVESNGGPANLQSLTSLAASGEVIDGDENSFFFKLYRKRPNKMRMQVDLPNQSIVTSFDGARVFQQISVRGAPAVIEEITGEDARQIKADSFLDGPFYQLRSRPEWLEVVAEVEVAGVPAYEVLIDERADSPYQRVWISQEHYQEIKLIRMIETADSGEVLEEIFFDDFEQIKGVWLAKHIRYHRDGELVQSVQIEKVRINVGLFDSFFAKPKS
ncbi:hypothetical protein ACWPKS_13035 [Coraliomargarita sp. W4R72]